jgi:hypothetical protein
VVTCSSIFSCVRIAGPQTFKVSEMLRFMSVTTALTYG